MVFFAKTSLRRLLLSLASVLCAGLDPAVHAVTLVADGQAQASIIIPEDALPLTRSAAGELAEVLREMSGASVNVTESPASVQGGNRIWVGVRPEVLALLSPEEQQLKYPEEILIKATENDLILIGSDTFRGGRQVEAGTRIAVTTYLQDHLGVRWLWPGELGTEVPRKKTVRTDPMLYRYHPKLRWRELRGVNHQRALETMKELGPIPGVDDLAGLLRQKDDEVREWLHHHKADHATAGGVSSPLRGSLTFNAGHAYSTWWERFHRKHPEWFALQPDGTRGPFPSPKDVKINPSNPEVAAQWLKDAKTFFTENPDRLFRSAAENDRGWQGYCICETCLSWDSPDAPWLENTLSWAKKKGVRSRALTDRYVKYWNILGRGLKEMFPDRDLYVGVMAYNPMRPAPVREKLEPNIAVAFEGIHVRNPIDNSREKEAIGRKMWKDWASMAEMMIWRPNLIHQTAGLPYVFPRRHSENMKFLADNKMVGISVDSIGNHWATQGPNYYVVAQLAWNPYLDVEVLLKDYYQSAFGPAAPYVARYFDLFEKLYDDLAERYGEAGWHRNRDLPKLYRERLAGERPDKTKRLGEEGVERQFELEEAATQLLEQAKKAVAGAPMRYQQRVAFIAKGLEFTRLQLDGIQAMNDLRDGKGRRPDLLIQAEIAGERRREFLEENIHDQAIGYYELLGRQLLGGASDFGPPSVAERAREAEIMAKALEDEKGEAVSSEKPPVIEKPIR